MLYDKETGLAVTGTPEEIHQKVLNQQAVFKKGTTSANIIDSEGESAGSADINNLPELFKRGYRLETPTEGIVNDYVDENKGISGSLKVGLTESVNAIGLGIPEIIAEKTLDPLEVAKYKALRKDHTYANVAGTVGGTLATFINPVTAATSIAGKLLLPAGKLFQSAAKVGAATEKYVAEKLTNFVGKNIATSIAPKIVGGAAEGAVIMAPQAITETMLGDPDTAAESLMAGGAVGGIFGTVVGIGGPIFSKLGKMAKDKVDDVPKLKELHENAALNAIGASPSQRVNLKSESSDVVAMLPKFLDDATKGERSLLTNPTGLGKRIGTIEEGAGATLDKTVRQLDEKINQIASQTDDVGRAVLEDGMYNYQTLVQTLDEKFIKLYAGDPLYASQVKKAQGLVDSINNHVNVNLGGNLKALNLTALRDYQQKLSKLISETAYGSEQSVGIEALKFVKRDIQDYFKNLTPKIKETFPELGALADQFKNANDLYRVAATVKDIVQKTGERADGKQFFGLLDTTAGAAGALAGGSVGGIGGFAAGIAAKKAWDYARGWYNVGGLLLTEEGIAKVAKKLDAIPKALSSITKTVKAQSISKLSSLTGDKDDDDYGKLSKKLNNFIAAPQNNEMVKSLDAMADSGAPKVAEATKLKTIEAAAYLASLMPKPLTPDNPLVKGRTYKPSDMEMTKFTRQIKIAMDPMSAIDDLNDGTLTKDQVDVLANLYPKLLDEMKTRVITAVSDNTEAVPYNKRLKLSLLLGMDLDPSLAQNISAIIMTPPQAQTPPPQNGNPNANFTTYPSENQRIQNDMK